MPRDMSEHFNEEIAAAKGRTVVERDAGMQQILQSWASRPRHKPVRGQTSAMSIQTSCLVALDIWDGLQFHSNWLHLYSQGTQQMRHLCGRRLPRCHHHVCLADGNTDNLMVITWRSALPPLQGCRRRGRV